MLSKTIRSTARVTRARSPGQADSDARAPTDYARVLICDAATCHALIEERQRRGIDGFDEVWEGVYVVSPIANEEHQGLISGLIAVLQLIVGWPGLGKVYPGVNVSDRDEDWTQNYRVPEVAVYLAGNPARNCRTHWFGGPDFAVEIVSKEDRSREKLGFYAKVGTRELLLIDRFPWALELYALKGKKLKLVGRSTLEKPKVLQSTVLPLSFRLVAGDERPQVEISHADEGRTWLV